MGCENCRVVFLLWAFSPTHPGWGKGRGKPREWPGGGLGLWKKGLPLPGWSCWRKREELASHLV